MSKPKQPWIGVAIMLVGAATLGVVAGRAGIAEIIASIIGVALVTAGAFLDGYWWAKWEKWSQREQWSREDSKPNPVIVVELDGREIARRHERLTMDDLIRKAGSKAKTDDTEGHCPEPAQEMVPEAVLEWAVANGAALQAADIPTSEVVRLYDAGGVIPVSSED